VKILLYENRKIDPICWDVSTPEKEKAGFLALFNYLDKDWGYYDGLEEWEKELADVNELLKKLNSLKEECLKDIFQHEKERLKVQKKELEELKQRYFMLQKARNGNAVAAKSLLSQRLEYEYEYWQIIEVENPLEERE